MKAAEMKAITEEIATRLRQLRLSRNYTQLEVAQAIEITKETYAEIEEGSLDSCPVELFYTLAELYQVSIKDILPAN